MGPRRDVSELLYPAVCETIASLDLQPEDAGMVKLARHLARVIDEAPGSRRESAARWLGAELRQVLECLGASPAARARLKGDKPADEPASPLRKLRSIAT
jgi:hypothetical protein